MEKNGVTQAIETKLGGYSTAQRGKDLEMAEQGVDLFRDGKSSLVPSVLIRKPTQSSTAVIEQIVGL